MTRRREKSKKRLYSAAKWWYNKYVIGNANMIVLHILKGVYFL